jgi:hypothetical protein
MSKRRKGRPNPLDPNDWLKLAVAGGIVFAIAVALYNKANGIGDFAPEEPS